jgi:hypothetical protein
VLHSSQSTSQSSRSSNAAHPGTPKDLQTNSMQTASERLSLDAAPCDALDASAAALDARAYPRSMLVGSISVDADIGRQRVNVLPCQSFVTGLEAAYPASNFAFEPLTQPLATYSSCSLSSSQPAEDVIVDDLEPNQSAPSSPQFRSDLEASAQRAVILQAVNSQKESFDTTYSPSSLSSEHSHSTLTALKGLLPSSPNLLSPDSAYPLQNNLSQAPAPNTEPPARQATVPNTVSSTSQAPVNAESRTSQDSAGEREVRQRIDHLVKENLMHHQVNVDECVSACVCVVFACVHAFVCL